MQAFNFGVLKSHTHTHRHTHTHTHTYIYIYIFYIHTLNAQGRSARPKQVTYNDEINKILWMTEVRLSIFHAI